MHYDKKALTAIFVTAAVMIIVSLVQWRYALPLGRVGVLQLGPAVGLGALIAMGVQMGLVTFVLGMAGMILFGTGDWVSYGALVIAAIVPLVRMSRREQPIELSRNQVLVIGFASGLLYYAATLGLTVLRGYLLGHSGMVALTFGRQALAPGLLAGIVIGYFAASFAMMIQSLPTGYADLTKDDKDIDLDYRGGVRKSVIIDLHDPKKKNRDRHDDDDHDHKDKQD